MVQEIDEHSFHPVEKSDRELMELLYSRNCSNCEEPLNELATINYVITKNRMVVWWHQGCKVKFNK